MNGKFDTNVMKLEKQINNINENIHKFKNKNHKTMLTIIEKIKLFTNNDNKPQNKAINLLKTKPNETPKKTLIKRYKSLSSNNISFTTRNKKKNKNKYKQNNDFMILREDADEDEDEYEYEYENENEDIYNTYSNKMQFHSNEKDRKIHLLSDFNYIPEKFNENDIYDFYEYDKNDFRKKNCFSFNNDNCCKCNGRSKYRIKGNNIDSRKRINSYNYNTNNNLRNEFTDDYNNNFINEDLNNFKKNKNKKINSHHKKEEIQKRISEIENLTDDQSDKLKQIKYIKRENCNLNISNYYRNIKNKNNKKNSKIKITNNQKLKKHLYNKKDRLNNSNNHKNYNSRNYSSNKVNNSIKNDDMNNKENEKEYTNIVCSTFNPNYFKNNQNNANFNMKGKKNISNSFREKSLLRNNTYSNNNINNLNLYKYNRKINPDLDNKVINFNQNANNNKNNNNNFSKDFIDIITNKNNGGNGNKDINNNMYNNIIYQKKEINRNNNNVIKEDKINILLLKLNSKNLDECLHKIDILLDYEDFIYKVNSLYNKIINFNKNILVNKRSLNEIFSWIESIIEENKKQKESLKRYQIFCGKLTEEFSVDGFDKFKNFIVQTLNKNKKSQSFTSEKKLISESVIYNENKNIINKRNGNISINTYFYNNEENSPLKNRTLSFSNISMNRLQNGDENSNINNTFYLSNKKNKALINKAKNYNML